MYADVPRPAPVETLHGLAERDKLPHDLYAAGPQAYPDLYAAGLWWLAFPTFGYHAGQSALLGAAGYKFHGGLLWMLQTDSHNVPAALAAARAIWNTLHGGNNGR